MKFSTFSAAGTVMALWSSATVAQDDGSAICQNPSNFVGPNTWSTNDDGSVSLCSDMAPFIVSEITDMPSLCAAGEGWESSSSVSAAMIDLTASKCCSDFLSGML